ncbi:MAG: NADH-quinone oxidoreductase subunit NuoH [Nitrospinota bacterium]|jgi:NADH-quinone oxidoreductase subunit H|nr:NADH-quinone oxidoreductase subunit NuoH [Nitrospinota bacterium]MDP7581309.1 NADH-quinone oxidoreductase subunit NuoH [Nitrospinota bacterium]HJN03104.1 NADH-quinone oxidoreductase subunit NuoH [Nitrospinota bacterium]
MEDFLITTAKVLFIFGLNMGVFAPLLTWVERKQSALMQDRIGANRADILGFSMIGLFHPIADAIKMLAKEDFIPEGANKIMHTLSPIICVVPALLTFAVIPFGGEYVIGGKHIKLVIADLDVGLIFIFAISSLATYGTVIAGWSSNNNWSLLGSLRASAQMISYEVAMGFTLVGVFMVYGSLQLTQIGAAQESFFRWGIFLQPLGFFMFLACAIAENKRAPFDVAEGESEIIAGYFLEYSGLKFGMFYMAEFLEIVTISAMVTTLFFGAWHIPFISSALILSMLSFLNETLANIILMLIHISVFWVKVIFFIWFQMTIRWTLPRFRYDQIMKLGWKILLPLSLANILVTGIVILILQ